jgi:drug/metabolite transporter (DMT)-like permease
MVVFGGILYPWLFLLALSRTSATNTALLIALNPVVTLLLSPFVGERLERRRIAGLAIALLGAVVVITHGDVLSLRTLSFHGGDLLAFAGACAWAVFNVASRRVVAHLTPAFTNCVIYGAGSVALAVLSRTDHPWAELAAVTPVGLGWIAVMAVMSSVVAGQLFLVGVRTVGVGRTVVFVYLVPVLTAALSAVLLGEHFEPAQAVGGAAVVAGLYWSNRGPLA